MLVKDTQSIMRLAQGDEIYRSRQKVFDEKKHRTQEVKAFDASSDDPTNRERQKGKQMMTQEFIGKLKRLLPDLYWFLNPEHDNIAVIRHGLTSVPCMWPVMPEWSVVKFFFEEMPVEATKHILTAEGYKIPVYTPDTPPAQMEPTSFLEIERGWRTVLMRFVQEGKITLTAVEQVFGYGERASWAKTLKYCSLQPDDLVLSQ